MTSFNKYRQYFSTYFTNASLHTTKVSPDVQSRFLPEGISRHPVTTPNIIPSLKIGNCRGVGPSFVCTFMGSPDHGSVT